ncbi:dehydrogenase/reductase SDR family member 11-like [Schistocerca serialis cubense]|uniref:dehydrogenase/reductase SDR family member 11-like n=1 Tax=Schistocerca serialis cubense TaxID=2023355 RepID=UPI00214DF6E3|nr:dehydrogenase/reductase SDR family member 11-like [Schistocerca serialis cubense]
MDRYQGRVALVTGASAGIGAAITQALLRRGVNVVGLARRVDRVQALELKDAPGNLYALEGDLSKEESILAAFKWIKENLSGVDILINNAGVLIDEQLTSGRTETWTRMLDVNVLGLSVCTREAVQDMISRGVDDGFIIHINSLWGHTPPANSETAMYAATKHAVRVLLEGLRKDLVARKSNIRVGEISPGMVKTEILTNTTNWTEDLYNQLNYMEAEDVAEAVIYMLSQHPRVQVYDIILRPTGNPY